MKALMTAIVLFFTLSSATMANRNLDPDEVVGDRCAPGDVIFYAKTLDLKSEILVCQWDTNVFYQYGKIGQKPTTDFKRQNSKVEAIVYDDDYHSGQGLNFVYNNVNYRVWASNDLNDGEQFAKVTITNEKTGASIDTIMFDPDTVIDRIRDGYVE